MSARQQGQLRSIVRNDQRNSADAGAIARVSDNPAAIPGDADQGDDIPVGVEGTKHVRCGRPGYVVLPGAPAEQDSNPRLAFSHRFAARWSAEDAAFCL